MSLRHLDLFSGIGGFALAAGWAGNAPRWMIGYDKGREGFIMPRKMKDDVVKYCLACSKLLTRKRFANSLESYARFKKRQHCDEKCMAKTMLRPDSSRSAALKIARKFRKSECENCGKKENLSTHHIDRNWRNNNPDNLSTLCSSCHSKHHYDCEEIGFKKKDKPDCYVCGKKSYKQSLCNTCRSRKWRTGSEYKSG